MPRGLSLCSSGGCCGADGGVGGILETKEEGGRSIGRWRSEGREREVEVHSRPWPAANVESPYANARRCSAELAEVSEEEARERLAQLGEELAIHGAVLQRDGIRGNSGHL